MTPSRSEWGGEDFLCGPAVVDPVVQRMSANAEDFGPACQRLSSSVERNEVVVPPVPALHVPRRPAAVGGAIISAVVDPVEAVLCSGPSSHAAEERLKRISPLLAHGDAAPTIVMELRVAAVVAALKHVVPGYVLGGPSVSGGVSMGRGPGGALTAALTPGQAVDAGNGLLPTRASEAHRSGLPGAVGGPQSCLYNRHFSEHTSDLYRLLGLCHHALRNSILKLTYSTTMPSLFQSGAFAKTCGRGQINA